MSDIDDSSQLPERRLDAPNTPEPLRNQRPVRHQVLDLLVLLGLLAVCAGVYVVVGDGGFSAIVGAVAGLFGIICSRRNND
ncbi:hypothetical protein [Streptomyces sp. SID1121]|uniref:hypothetical protein n=1 Tax=Streptomyces sp. SID1121 TaxID=3425888 RepID=UPI00405764C8